MSSFSNTDTGNKSADPYTAKNIQEPSLKEKVEDLQTFVDKSKFCMMTTKTQDGLLASRCMALAARVSPTIILRAYLQHPLTQHNAGGQRHRFHLPHQYRVRQDRRPQGAL